MQTQLIGRTALRSTRLIYGCMRTVGTWNPKEVDRDAEQQARAAVLAAYEAGYTHFDHADIYCQGECERVFGTVLKDNAEMRQRIVITTKCGIRFDEPHRYDFSREHILRSAEGSLQRLGVETIDLYLLHRPDRLMDPHEVAGAFDQLRRDGKVREFGVSNFTGSQLRLLQSVLSMPLACNQIEMHPGRLAPIEDGTLDTCMELRVTPTAWSPVGGGRFGEDASSDDPQQSKLLEAIDAEAKQHGVSRPAMTLAWLMRHPSGIMPIVGSRNPDRIRDATAADGVQMSRESWYRIYLAARGKKLP